MIRAKQLSPFGTSFHSVVTTSSVPLAISRFACVSIVFVLGASASFEILAFWTFMNLQLQGRSTRKRVLCIRGGIVLVVSVAFGGIVFTHKRSVEHRGRVPAPARVVTRIEPDVPRLTVEHIIQHGHIVEIQASVPPGATVMVNGQRAAVIWGDGEIRHFVGPLPEGVSDIAITVQNDMGGINTQQISVALP